MNTSYTIEIYREDTSILEDILAQNSPVQQTRIYTIGEKFIYLTHLSIPETILIKLSLGERVNMDRIFKKIQ